MVRGTSEVNLDVDTNASKLLVLEYTKQVLQEEAHDKLDQFVSAELVQHAALIASGRAGLAAWLGSEDAGQYEMLFRLIGQGDFVVTYGKRYAHSKEIATFDVYRVADGLIVEHWQNTEVISPRDAWGNSGKF